MRRSLIPVMLNGTSGYLVMVFTTANPDGVIAGFTEGYDANGLARARSHPAAKRATS